MQKEKPIYTSSFKVLSAMTNLAKQSAFIYSVPSRDCFIMRLLRYKALYLNIRKGIQDMNTRTTLLKNLLCMYSCKLFGSRDLNLVSETTDQSSGADQGFLVLESVGTYSARGIKNFFMKLPVPIFYVNILIFEFQKLFH